jgi:D-alanyl-D-alanine dipeptidase
MSTYFILGSLMITATLCAAEIKTELVEIQKMDSSILIDLRYATDNNFTQEPIYPASFKCMFAKEAAQALCLVQKELQAKGLGLKVWDAYRPRSCQIRLWQVCAKQYPDEKERSKYVGNPYKEGGRHLRGYSIDLTLVDDRGNELLMPTPFDDFSVKAWPDAQDVDPIAKKNRTILIVIMKKYGFTPIETEWWHFDYQGWKDQPILDVVM